MKIVDSVAKIWHQGDDIYEHIAKCARVCYASNKSLDANDYTFCKKLWRNKHKSMFRHAGVYYIIPEALDLNYRAYGFCNIVTVESIKYISTNKQCAKEYFQKYKRFEISTNEAWVHPIFREHGLIMLTFNIGTGIDITREFNRKSPNNIAEQSTRYVDFNKRVGIKFKRCHWMKGLNLYRRFITWFMCKVDEWFYKISRSKYGLNLPPEDARWCLFLDTYSNTVYTYSVKTWEYIINMRLFDYTGKAHKDAKTVAQFLYDQLTALNFNIKNYKENEDNKSECMVSNI